MKVMLKELLTKMLNYYGSFVKKSGDTMTGQLVATNFNAGNHYLTNKQNMLYFRAWFSSSGKYRYSTNFNVTKPSGQKVVFIGYVYCSGDETAYPTDVSITRNNTSETYATINVYIRNPNNANITVVINYITHLEY